MISSIELRLREQKWARAMKKSGMSVRKIAKETGFHRSKVHRLVTEKVCLKKGKPPARSTPADMYRRFRIIRGLLHEEDDRGRDIFHSAPLVSAEAAKRGTPVGTPSTVRNLCNRYGCDSYVRKIKPKVYPGDNEKRVAFARRHQRSKMSQDSIIFSDEKNFDLNNRGPRLQWRMRHEEGRIRERESYSHTVMIWGAIGINYRKIVVFPKRKIDPDGVEKAYRMNSNEYKRRCLQTEVPIWKQRKRVLMHDGARAHTAKHIGRYLEEKKVPFLRSWPPRSPHLNPIENFWADLQKKVSNRSPRSTDELVKFIREEFTNTPQSYLNNLCRSFDRRLKESVTRGGKP